MSSIAGRTKPKRRYAMQRALAPHVDEEWTRSFVAEQRLLGVEGAYIGAALSEVESHCVESRQSAQTAFGTPVEYARSLQLPVNSGKFPTSRHAFACTDDGAGPGDDPAELELRGCAARSRT
jgi:hypothetical protein